MLVKQKKHNIGQERRRVAKEVDKLTCYQVIQEIWFPD